MEIGRTVILLNLETLYESLYDVLNQVCTYVGCAYATIVRAFFFTFMGLLLSSTTFTMVAIDMLILDFRHTKSNVVFMTSSS